MPDLVTVRDPWRADYERAALAASRDLTRPHLACVTLATASGSTAWCFTATDGHRLHRRRLADGIVTASDPGPHMIPIGSDPLALARKAAPRNRAAELTLQSRREAVATSVVVGVRNVDRVACAPAIDTPYDPPPHDRVIVRPGCGVIVHDVGALLHAATWASHIPEERLTLRAVDGAATGCGLVATLEHGHDVPAFRGALSTTLRADVIGTTPLADRTPIIVDARYLADALTALAAPRVRITWDGHIDPVRLDTGESDDNAANLAIIMPKRR